MGPWSIGTQTIESSIQNAYIQMIDAAKYYIYIEVGASGARTRATREFLQNQFFITVSNDTIVKNQLAEALFRRVLRAHA